MKNKRLSSFVLAVGFMFSCLLSACGEAISNNGEDIVLVEPIGISQSFVTVESRDLISYSTYAGKVIPTVTEASFSTNQNFLEYGVLPGTEIKKNQALIYASTEKVDDEIKALKEAMDNADENYNEFIKDTAKNRSSLKSDIDSYGEVVETIDGMSTEEKSWYMTSGLYQKFKSIYINSVASLERLEESEKETSDMYLLDKNYNEKKLSRLNKERNNSLALSPADGTVVSINYFDKNEHVNKEFPVGAVGDFNNLLIISDRVQTGDIKMAMDYYALINGVRYEVSFVEPDNTGRSAATQGSETANTYSTFILKDKNADIKSGDFATIVVVKANHKDAVCVPTSVIESEGSDKIVHKIEGESIVSCIVKTGIRSGFYTEILSGLNVGDFVVGEFKVDETSKEIKVERGSVSTTNKTTGYLFYPKSEIVKNEVEHGTTYLKEIFVKQYQRVEKGQTIARVYVVQDDIEIRRMERNILRAEEDLNELLKGDLEKNEKAINLQKKSIDEMNKKLNEIKKDANVTKIVSPIDGIITEVVKKEEGDILLFDSFVVSVASEANSFIVIEDSAGNFTTGNEAIIEYKDDKNLTQSVAGKVVTVTPWALSKELNTGYALISVSQDDLEKLSSLNSGNEDRWWRTRFDVSISTRSVDNVLVVPKNSVYLENGIHYVIVKDENGNYVYKSFMSGGSDNANYWVIDGLTEGMTICSK